MRPASTFRAKLQSVALDEDLEWLLPTDVLPGCTQLFGMPVRHVDGIDAPYLAHRLTITKREERP